MTTIERTVSTTSTRLTARSSSCTSVSSTRKQNRTHFAKYYSDLCHIQHSHPLSAIKQNLDKGILDFYCDRIKFDEWWSIINALSCDKTLHFVAIRCRHPQKQPLETADTELKARAVTKQPVVTTRFVLLWLAEAIKMCLGQSSTLTVLELEGLPLSRDYLTPIASGLMETATLQHFSLSKCPVGDEGAQIVCQAIRNLPSVVSLDMSQCDLTERGAEIIAGLIKYQKLNRYSEAWKQTLRYRDPDVEAMPGLRRITLNNNPTLGDEGIGVLIEEIKDDLWLRAFDVQDCGLTRLGGTLLLDLLESNTNLHIVDARGNPFMDDDTLLQIMNQLALNNRHKDTTDYKWINKNLDLNKKKFQASRVRPRPWTSQSSTRLPSRAPPPSEYSSPAITARPLLKRSNTTLNPDALRRKTHKAALPIAKEDPNFAENERLRLQLRDLTLILTQEVRHKLALLEENKALKQQLEKEEIQRKKTGNGESQIEEDTLKVIEETITRFGEYIGQKNRSEQGEDEWEETEEKTQTDSELPQLVSNLQVILKKAASVTSESLGSSQNETVRHPSVSDKKVSNELNKGDINNEEKVERTRKQQWRHRKADQTIWEEEETKANCGDIGEENLRDSGKSRAQAMFLQILKGRDEKKGRVGRQLYVEDFQDEASSNESDTNTESKENLKKYFSSYEDTSS